MRTYKRAQLFIAHCVCNVHIMMCASSIIYHTLQLDTATLLHIMHSTNDRRSQLGRRSQCINDVIKNQKHVTVSLARLVSHQRVGVPSSRVQSRSFHEWPVLAATLTRSSLIFIPSPCPVGSFMQPSESTSNTWTRHYMHSINGIRWVFFSLNLSNEIRWFYLRIIDVVQQRVPFTLEDTSL